MINCHASSTIVGDISEARGVRNILKNKNIHDSMERFAAMDPVNLSED